MKTRHTTPLLFLLALVLTVMAASPAAAAPVHYGTGIHLWALSCGPYPDGHSTVAYVSSSVCPNNPPAGCTCTRTLHDFPTDHPYPSRVVIGNPEPVEGGEGGEVNVIIDFVGAIQCGATVQPPAEDTGTCGALFTTRPVEAEQVDPAFIELVESLRFEIEQQTGGPATFSFSYAER
jgi:hypothetical protein